MELNRFENIILKLHDELEYAEKNFHPFHSTHEGYGVIKEEFDELWDEIKASKVVVKSNERMRKECIQVATMAIRFILDLDNE